MVTITEQNETKSEFVPGPGVYEFDDLQEVKSNLETEFDAEEKKLKYEDNLKMVILNKYFQISYKNSKFKKTVFRDTFIELTEQIIRNI